MCRAGRGEEIAVALVSAGIFALLHAGSFFTSNHSLGATIAQVACTFGSGVCMWLALRMTRMIWAPILRCVSSDPTLSLHGASPEANCLTCPRLSTVLIVVTSVVLLIVLMVSECRWSRWNAE